MGVYILGGWGLKKATRGTTQKDRLLMCVDCLPVMVRHPRNTLEGEQTGKFQAEARGPCTYMLAVVESKCHTGLS